METQITYEIQNMDKEIVEKGYVNVETADDDEPEIYVENADGSYVPESTWGSVDIDTYIYLHCIFEVHRYRAWFRADINIYSFLEAIWHGLDGRKYEYEENDYTITINPYQK